MSWAYRPGDRNLRKESAYKFHPSAAYAARSTLAPLKAHAVKLQMPRRNYLLLWMRLCCMAVCQQLLGNPQFHASRRMWSPGGTLSLHARLPPTGSLSRLAPTSGTKLGAGTLDCEKPQSKQTKSFGNSQTPGLSRFLSPPKCI